MLASSYIVLFFRGLPVWLLACVPSGPCHLIGFLILWKRGLTVGPAPSLVSKMTTVFQMLTIVYILAFAGWSFDLFFFYTTALLTAISGIQYVFTGSEPFFRKEAV